MQVVRTSIAVQNTRFASFARSYFLLLPWKICISRWPGMQVGWTNIAGQNRGGWVPMHRLRLQWTPDDHILQKTSCARLENRPHCRPVFRQVFSPPEFFCKFFGKAGNILPQIKHERPQRSYVAVVHRGSEKRGGHHVSCLTDVRLLKKQASAWGCWRKKKGRAKKWGKYSVVTTCVTPCLSLVYEHTSVSKVTTVVGEQHGGHT